MLVDAQVELFGLAGHALSGLKTGEDQIVDVDILLRGHLVRVQALSNVMYAAACGTDEELHHYLAAAYGKHHAFVNTPATELEKEVAHG